LTGPGGVPSTAFLTFGRPPTASQLANPNSSCGLKNSPELHVAYCEEAGQNLMQGWNTRRNEWQYGFGVQHEVLPRVSAELTYNLRQYGNLTDSDTVNLGCDYFGPRAVEFPAERCLDEWQNYNDPTGLRDFYTFTVPEDPRLPGGGGYTIRGLVNQAQPSALPTGGGNVTIIHKDRGYYWHGFDTNFVIRPRGGFRISGGTSTGKAVRDTCRVDTDTPNVKGRVGNELRGGCLESEPWRTNVRANSSYTIPFVDVLAGVVFQYRPGAPRTANLQINSAWVEWEAGSAHRAGSPFNTNTGTTTTTTVNLLDNYDLIGEGIRLTDLTFRKNIRFAGKRLTAGVDVYNLFNTDAATGYQNTYTAFLVNGQWQADDPSTPNVEINDWNRVTNIQNPRFARFSLTFDF
jgi:hypothetical protein